jgi:glycosyltransferase involved in cell wall biosynthesis
VPTLSVCVPTCNGARWITETLRSILDQHVTDLEVIVGDDASTDGTTQMAATVGDSRLRIHRFHARAGLAGNWNRTLALARGRYVAIVGQDDLVTPDWAGRLVTLLDKHPDADLAFGRRTFRFEDRASRQLLGKFFEVDYPAMLSTFYHAIGEVVPTNVMVAQAARHGFGVNLIGEPSFVIFRRTARAAADGFDPAFSQMIDWEFYTRFIAEGPIVHCSSVVGEYRLHDEASSFANLKVSRHREDLALLLERLESRFAAHLDDAHREVIAAQRRALAVAPSPMRASARWRWR